MTALTLARQHCPDVPFFRLGHHRRGAGHRRHGIMARRTMCSNNGLVACALGPGVHCVSSMTGAERKRAEEALRHSENNFGSPKMESGWEAGVVSAHDFNNLLTGIMGYSQVLLTDWASTSSSRKDRRKTLKAGDGLRR